MYDYCKKIKTTLPPKQDAMAREITNFLCYLRKLLRQSTNKYVSKHTDQNPDRWDCALVRVSSTIDDDTRIYIGYSTSTQELFDQVVAALDKIVHCDIAVEPSMNCANIRAKWFHWTTD